MSQLSLGLEALLLLLLQAVGGEDPGPWPAGLAPHEPAAGPRHQVGRHTRHHPRRGLPHHGSSKTVLAILTLVPPDPVPAQGGGLADTPGRDPLGLPAGHRGVPGARRQAVRRAHPLPRRRRQRLHTRARPRGHTGDLPQGQVGTGPIL